MSKMAKFFLLVVALVIVAGVAFYTVQLNSKANTYEMLQPSTGGSSSESSTMVLPSQASQPFKISTVVRDSQGQPLVNAPVEFDVKTNFFGERPLKIGTSQTDGKGVATITYNPSTDGTYEFTVQYLGDGSHPQAVANQTITYSGPVAQYRSEAVGMLPIRTWITPVVFAGVGLFWLLLVVIAVRTLGGIFSARHDIMAKYK